jgi:hypothetical protein
MFLRSLKDEFNHPLQPRPVIDTLFGRLVGCRTFAHRASQQIAKQGASVGVLGKLL